MTDRYFSRIATSSQVSLSVSLSLMKIGMLLLMLGVALCGQLRLILSLLYSNLEHGFITYNCLTIWKLSDIKWKSNIMAH